MINPRARPCDEQVIRSARGAADCTASQRRWVLVATILASVIAYIDGSVVNVALPVISKDLATSVAVIQWVINAYTSLRADGFVVVVFQPAQVRAYAKFVLQHAKNDAIDAALIARCTAAATDIREPPDARLALLAQHLTMIEQLTEDVGQLKTRREACREERIREFWKREINRLKVLLSSELKQLVVAIREHRDLSDRLDLIASVDGVGLRTAVAILVRMPEIGRVTREQAAAIVGLAPYDNDSGLRHGSRHIKGGRQRLRQSLYAAALPAVFYWNPQLQAFYKRLLAAGKSHTLALVACARKLIIFVNTVVARGTPWTSSAAAA